MQVFTASGGFTVPNGVTAARVTVLGAGGGGGYHASMPSGGGGAGGRAVGIVGNLMPGSVIAVTVGAGGNAPASPGNGTNGGQSSFGGYMTANGGGGGGGGTSTGAGPVGYAGGAGAPGLVMVEY